MSDTVKKFSQGFVRFAALVLCAAAAVSLGCREKPREEPKPLSVSTVKVFPEEARRMIDTFGQVAGAKEVRVYAQVGGILKRLAFTEGARVKAGDILFEIEKEPYEAALSEAQAAVGEARAKLAQAASDFKRAQRLVKLEAVSRKEHDAARSALAQARAALTTALAREKTARINLSHAVIASPVDGVAGKSEINVGSLVTAYSTLLTEITQPELLRVDFAVSDKDFAAGSFDANNAVTVIYDDGRKSVQGKLDFIAAGVDVATASVRMRAELPRTQGLLPGQYVTVRVQAQKLENAFRVPQKAVRQKADGTYGVFVVRDGRALEKLVVLSHWEGKDWIVASGLEAGDEVIVDRMLSMRSGARVAPVDSPR